MSASGMRAGWQRGARRLLAAVALFALLGGPTPGAVGACDDSVDGFADLSEYCKEREELTCVRRALRKELSTQERDDCRREALSACERRFWAPDCRPTTRQANACLNALRAEETVNTPEDELDECNTQALCTVKTSAAGSGSFDAPGDAGTADSRARPGAQP
jgi:hypothetical protein